MAGATIIVSPILARSSAVSFNSANPAWATRKFQVWGCKNDFFYHTFYINENPFLPSKEWLQHLAQYKCERDRNKMFWTIFLKGQHQCNSIDFWTFFLSWRKSSKKKRFQDVFGHVFKFPGKFCHWQISQNGGIGAILLQRVSLRHAY